MKFYRISFFLLIISLISVKSFLNTNYNSFLSVIRNLWEQNIEYKKRSDSDDNNSLKHCSKSSPKYFSFVLSGEPVTFDHFINSGNAVSKN